MEELEEDAWSKPASRRPGHTGGLAARPQKEPSARPVGRALLNISPNRSSKFTQHSHRSSQAEGTMATTAMNGSCHGMDVHTSRAAAGNPGTTRRHRHGRGGGAHTCNLPGTRGWGTTAPNCSLDRAGNTPQQGNNK